MFIQNPSPLDELSSWISTVEEIGIVDVAEMHQDLHHLAELIENKPIFVRDLREINKKWNRIMIDSGLEDSCLSSLVDKIASQMLPKREGRGYINPSNIFRGQIAAALYAEPRSMINQDRAAAQPSGLLENAIFNYSPVQAGLHLFEQPLENQIRALETFLEVLRESFGKSRDPMLCTIQIQHAQNYLAALRQLQQQRAQKPKDEFSFFSQAPSEAPAANKDSPPQSFLPFPTAQRYCDKEESPEDPFDSEMGEPPLLRLDKTPSPKLPQ